MSLSQVFVAISQFAFVPVLMQALSAGTQSWLYALVYELAWD